MNIMENKAIVESFYAAGDVGDVETLMRLLSDDISWTNIGSTEFSGTFAGKDDFVTRLLGPVFSRLKGGIKSTVDLVVAEGDHVVVQVRGTAETIDGRPYNNTYCHIFRIGDSKIVEVTEYFDTAMAQSVLGSVKFKSAPSAPSRGSAV